ncbi:hypothetical protein SEA_ANNADREAMY_142 [Streptomyces phage Annadreamy]|uniref:Uncharacterized protein n=3 Tax=Annadreamyvirus TaxID=2843347 RepID=A0A345GTG4_9CAUD|nr:hypothetical protein HWB75_gp127 [Streptomyces phage Annadreamy]YP_009839321.1 hypothetical protein HWB76_gp133 [Streptomyces phage Blueeyedbeauty]AXG66236.1 hypothetical protein SEA_ANNADREAMY_142 [Streptomyces phage Annadreamy]AXH49269.1 hypothetical protein SEA_BLUEEYEDBEAUTY_151 [Streptomyces phage Blueeyedbeauty]QGH79459.1 hypothetical protein SEA_LIMPID_149 [Streptomyces phage Limpid]
MAKRARMNSPVKISKPNNAINRRYKDELGIIFDIKTEERRTYYMVRLNGGHTISVDRDEITVL